MARFGPKPTPTALKRLKGNPGKRKLPAHEPDLPVIEDASTPRELARDAQAVEEWNRLAPMLQAAKVLTDADRASLIALCQVWSRYLTATAQLLGADLVIKSRHGHKQPNPYIGVANRALAQCLKLWAELGLTPASRSRVQANATARGAVDDFAEFDELASIGAH